MFQSCKWPNDCIRERRKSSIALWTVKVLALGCWQKRSPSVHVEITKSYRIVFPLVIIVISMTKTWFDKYRIQIRITSKVTNQRTITTLYYFCYYDYLSVAFHNASSSPSDLFRSKAHIWTVPHTNFEHH